MNKYNNSKIYKILSNREPKYYYIGSTVSDLNTRLRRHKSDSKVNPNVKKNIFFNSIDWDVQILLIQDINVTNFSELREIENNFIKQVINDDMCLNTYYSILNEQLRNQKTLAYGKQYYKNNIDEVRKKHNEYYLKTKDIQKQKYEDKKDSKNQKRREKITCDCGMIISRGYFSGHVKSKCHKDELLKNINL
jgi:hypothetical protein